LVILDWGSAEIKAETKHFQSNTWRSQSHW